MALEIDMQYSQGKVKQAWRNLFVAREATHCTAYFFEFRLKSLKTEEEQKMASVLMFSLAVVGCHCAGSWLSDEGGETLLFANVTSHNGTRRRRTAVYEAKVRVTMTLPKMNLHFLLLYDGRFARDWDWKDFAQLRRTGLRKELWRETTALLYRLSWVKLPFVLVLTTYFAIALSFRPTSLAIPPISQAILSMHSSLSTTDR